MRNYAQIGSPAAIALLLCGIALGLANGPIPPAGTSPRIRQLKQQLAAGVRNATGDFWVRLAREHTPIIEPVPGDTTHVLVTFVWRNQPGTRSVQVLESEMALLPNTDIWYRTFTVERDRRLSYTFKPVTASATDASPANRTDPLNPHGFRPPVAAERPASAVDPESPFMNSSILDLDGMPSSAWLEPQPGVPAGRVEERYYDSKIYAGKRRVWVYTPPESVNNSKRPAGLLICLWGRDYLNEIPVPTILDNLIHQRKIPPLVAVFVENDGDRFQNYQSTVRVSDSLSQELLPWAKKQWNIPAGPRRTIICGYSAAGLAATTVAFLHPDHFGNVLAQSGAFWRGFEGEGASEPEWLTHQYTVAPKGDTTFYLHVGGREVVKPGGNGPVFKEANRRLAEVLTKKGYRVSYTEVPGAEHEFIHWRSQFPQGLLFLTAGWTDT